MMEQSTFEVAVLFFAILKNIRKESSMEGFF